MSTIQAKASKRFLDAMGPMIMEEDKMNTIIQFIESMNRGYKYPLISYQELEECIPLETAFDMLENRIKEYFETAQ